MEYNQIVYIYSMEYDDVLLQVSVTIVQVSFLSQEPWRAADERSAVCAACVSDRWSSWVLPWHVCIVRRDLRDSYPLCDLREHKTAHPGEQSSYSHERRERDCSRCLRLRVHDDGCRHLQNLCHLCSLPSR